jgi:hypothetical protein
MEVPSIEPDDPTLYSTIRYSPGWYYQRWPGFYNYDCYRVLADFSMHPEKYLGVEESKENDMMECDTDESVNKNSKRKHENCESDCDL